MSPDTSNATKPNLAGTYTLPRTSITVCAGCGKCEVRT